MVRAGTVERVLTEGYQLAYWSSGGESYRRTWKRLGDLRVSRERGRDSPGEDVPCRMELANMMCCFWYGTGYMIRKKVCRTEHLALGSLAVPSFRIFPAKGRNCQLWMELRLCNAALPT